MGGGGRMNARGAQAKSKTDVVEEFRKATIQEAALRVVNREGLDSASMQAVAAEAGIAKGTIYLYFKNREELMESAAGWAVGQLRQQVEPLLSERNREPFAALLRQLIEAKLAFFQKHRDFFQIYLAASSPQKAACTPCAQYEQYLTSLAALLRRAMKRGQVRRGNPDRLALFVAAGVHAVLIRRLAEPKPPGAQAESDWIVELLLRGLALDGAVR